MTQTGEKTFSVIIPAYNSERLVGAAISSALLQTLPAHEIIVVDDGSTDRTTDVIEAYGSLVTFIQQPNAGTAAARNRAIKAATGTHIAWLDADDQFLPGYLEQVNLELAKHGPRTIVTSDALRITPTGLPGKHILPVPFPLPSDQRFRLLENNYIGVFSVYPRELHAEIGPIPEHATYAEDRQFWTSAIFRGWTVARAARPMALYRWMGGSKSNNLIECCDAEQEILRSLLTEDDVTLTEQETAYIQMRLASEPPRLILIEADQALRDRDFKKARVLLTKAAALLPGDKPLQVRAKLAKLWIGRLALAWRLARTDRKIGWHPGMNH